MLASLASRKENFHIKSDMKDLRVPSKDIEEENTVIGYVSLRRLYDRMFVAYAPGPIRVR